MSHSRRFCIPLARTLLGSLTASAHAQLYGPGTSSLSVALLIGMGASGACFLTRRTGANKVV